MGNKPCGKRVRWMTTGSIAIFLFLASCSSGARPTEQLPKAIKTRDELVKLFGKSRGFGPVQRAEFSVSGRQVLCVWYDPFSGRAACFLHAYYYDPTRHEWILFIDRLLENQSDLSAEMTHDSLIFRNSSGTVVLKEPVLKLPSEEWYSERKTGN